MATTGFVKKRMDNIKHDMRKCSTEWRRCVGSLKDNISRIIFSNKNFRIYFFDNVLTFMPVVSAIAQRFVIVKDNISRIIFSNKNFRIKAEIMEELCDLAVATLPQSYYARPFFQTLLVRRGVSWAYSHCTPHVPAGLPSRTAQVVAQVART
jgi:hypothetical protein